MSPAALPAVPTLGELSERLRPTVLSGEKTLPVVDALTGLLPSGGLVRGSSVSVAGVGATSLALALLSQASRTGSWIALVGVDSFGWAAATRSGWVLERTVSVSEPPTSAWATTVGALLDSVDVVVVDPTHQIRPNDARRLVARGRERGSILVRLSTPDGRTRFRWPVNADLDLRSETTQWVGLEKGAGHLQERRVTVTAGGRRRGGRSDSVTVMLPGRAGTVDSPTAEVTPLGRVG